MPNLRTQGLNEELILARETEATIIPAGDEVVLEAGTRAIISQALGGTVTIRTDSGLFPRRSKDWDAGAAAEAELNAAAAAAEAGKVMRRSAKSRCGRR